MSKRTSEVSGLGNVDELNGLPNVTHTRPELTLSSVNDDRCDNGNSGAAAPFPVALTHTWSARYSGLLFTTTTFRPSEALLGVAVVTISPGVVTATAVTVVSRRRIRVILPPSAQRALRSSVCNTQIHRRDTQIRPNSAVVLQTGCEPGPSAAFPRIRAQAGMWCTGV